ncbi:MAG: T9SS type A sorting domain-containing protein [Ignavibacteriae bacterium]|nr:T9SS type A sorting domain-containing protein [Ignavibacteriota bacterium]
MIKILRTVFFITAPLSLLFLIGFSGKDTPVTLTPESTPVRKHEVANEISKINKADLRDISLFTSSGDASSDPNLVKFSTNVTTLTMDRSALSTLYSEKPDNIVFNIPVGDGNVQLELTKVNIFDKDFRVTSINNGVVKRENYTPGVHYRGIIKGDINSLVSISIFPEFVMGVVSNDNGNYNLGSVKDNDGNNTDQYIYYNDRDRVEKSDFKCGVDGKDNKMRIFNPNNENMPLTPSDDPNGFDDTTRVYFLCDYQMYQDNGSSINNVGQFVEGMYNNVITIYRNESIKINISEIRVYTSIDPYAFSSNSETILTDFGQNTQDNFYGDLAHLLSTRNAGLGGIAWINVLCLPYQAQFSAGRFAFSNIEDNYSSYPTWSWTVNVVAHEMGHNFGSMHTHACAWPVFGTGGPLGAIDSCYNAEGNCFSTIRPINNGTIMSYCHLQGSVNLALGFGPLPGDTIRLRYQQAGCIQNTTNSSEAQNFTLDQNYPNPFNPGTTIRFELPVDAKVNLSIYDISGREIARLVDGQFYNKGAFSFYFDASSFNLASGVYFYRFNAVSAEGNQDSYSSVKKMILIK